MCPNLNTKGGRIINRRSRLKLLAAGVGAPLVAFETFGGRPDEATISPVKCWAHPSMNRSFSQSGMLAPGLSESRLCELDVSFLLTVPRSAAFEEKSCRRSAAFASASLSRRGCRRAPPRESGNHGEFAVDPWKLDLIGWPRNGD